MGGLLAFLLTLAGAGCFYLGWPHQKWLRARLPGLVAVSAGMVLLALGMTGWMLATRPLTGFFIFLTQLMLLWASFPFVGVYAQGR